MRNYELIEWLRQFDQMAMVQVQCVGDGFNREVCLDDSFVDRSGGYYIGIEPVPYTIVLSAD